LKITRAAKFEGVIIAEGLVKTDGKVTSIRVVKSPGLGLDESVIRRMKTWKCKPAKYEGKPVPVLVSFEIGSRL
jgi:TonB family protein